jgi:hypothetical protein
MATQALPAIIPIPGEIQFIDTPWQGQGLNTCRLPPAPMRPPPW